MTSPTTSAIAWVELEKLRDRAVRCAGEVVRLEVAAQLCLGPEGGEGGWCEKDVHGEYVYGS